MRVLLWRKWGKHKHSISWLNWIYIYNSIENLSWVPLVNISIAWAKFIVEFFFLVTQLIQVHKWVYINEFCMYYYLFVHAFMYHSDVRFWFLSGVLWSQIKCWISFQINIRKIVYWISAYSKLICFVTCEDALFG